MALEETAVTTVAEIPVHVAQERVRASSPCSDAEPQSRPTAPGNVLGHLLSVAVTRGHWGHPEKTDSSCTRSFLGSVLARAG